MNNALFTRLAFMNKFMEIKSDCKIKNKRLNTRLPLKHLYTCNKQVKVFLNFFQRVGEPGLICQFTILCILFQCTTFVVPTGWLVISQMIQIALFLYQL